MLTLVLFLSSSQRVPFFTRRIVYIQYAVFFSYRVVLNSVSVSLRLNNHLLNQIVPSNLFIQFIAETI